jgi:TrmH family RNA methyltransferase
MLAGERAPDVKRIDSRRNPAVTRYRSLAKHRDAGGRVLLEGAALIEEALMAGLEIQEAAVVTRRLDERDARRLIERLETRHVDVMEVSESVLTAISPVRSPSGWVAIADRPRTVPDDLFRTAPALVVALVDVQDPGNVGAVIRAAEAGGATGVMTTSASADPFGWKALRGAMGSALRLPIATDVNMDDAIARARGAGLQVLATVREGGRSHFAADLARPSMLLLGSEGSGLPQRLIDFADAKVSIAMSGPVESLNVAVAAGVLVFEAQRQRQRGTDPKDHVDRRPLRD